MKPYLKVLMEVYVPDTDDDDDDGLLHQYRKMYTVDVALDERNHTFMTYEFLDMLAQLRKSVGDIRFRSS